jgi:hypothetical protein
VTRVGTLRLGRGGDHRGAQVDERGVVVPDHLGWALDWRIGADDRWRTPQHETAVRQTLLGDAPVVRTAMRVPGGDALSEVYAVAEGSGFVVVEITNDSPAPFVAAFVVRGARALAVDDSVVMVDRRPGLLLPRAPSRWAVSIRGTTDFEVCGGVAQEGPFPPTKDRAGRAEAAFLVPVPHRVSVRAAIASAGDGEVLDPRSLPSAADVARGWVAQLDRGMRVELPEDRVTSAVSAARAQVLLAGQESRPCAEVFAALEDWGLDAEAAHAWHRLPGRERRRARTRPARPPRLDELDLLVARASTVSGMSSIAPELLRCVRALLAWEATDADEVVLLAELPDAWRGQPIDVHDVPTRAGLLSYAVRWHGERPALLWSAPPGVTVSAPGLDADWSSDDRDGEALLAPAVPRGSAPAPGSPSP